MVLGIIADTHGLMRPEVLDALSGVSAVVHAGDVGSAAVLDALAAIAPVHAIRGNVDLTGALAKLPATRVVRAGRARLYVLHDLAELPIDPAAKGFHAVISGHSHKPRNEVRGGVLYLNPGAAGPRRFRLPVAVARLHVDGLVLRPEMLTLG